QRTWWKYYGNTHTLKIIVAYLDDIVVAILPLYIQKQKLMRFINVNVMRFIGIGGDTSPDYLGLIGSQENNEEVLNLIVDVILNMKIEWDSLNITSMGTCKELATKLNVRCDKQGLSRLLTIDAHIPCIKLKKNWDEYLSELSSNRRSQVRRSRRKFEKLPNSRFYIWENEKDLSTVVDLLIELHHKRWKGRAEQYAFSSSEYVLFHREIIQMLFSKDLIRLCCLEVDGRIIAILYCYKWNKKYYYFQGGIDPDYASLKPGAVLMSYSIEQAIKEGEEVFDMLKGDYSFKRSLAKQENITWVFTAYNNSLIGKLMWLRLQIMPKLKRKFKSLSGKEVQI
ncbi:MAG: GNAT family N-acetyltransferase, partial [Thiohalomonadales bacterium]